MPTPASAAEGHSLLTSRGVRVPSMHSVLALLMLWCPLWVEPAEDSEDEEEEEEVENKDPPKKLKKKLPKEPPSGESREKKLKPKGKCLGEGDGLSPAPLSLASVLAGMKGPPAPRPHCCPRRLGGLQGNCPLPITPSCCPHLATSLSCHCPSPSTYAATYHPFCPTRREERRRRQSQICQKHQEGANVHVPGERGEEGEEKQEERYGVSWWGQTVLLPHNTTPSQQHQVLSDGVPCVHPQPSAPVMRRMILTPAPNPSGQRRRKTRCPSSRLGGIPPRRRKPKRKVGPRCHKGSRGGVRAWLRRGLFWWMALAWVYAELSFGVQGSQTLHRLPCLAHSCLQLLPKRLRARRRPQGPRRKTPTRRGKGRNQRRYKILPGAAGVPLMVGTAAVSAQGGSGGWSIPWGNPLQHCPQSHQLQSCSPTGNQEQGKEGSFWQVWF